MSSEPNKATVRGFFEALNAGNVEAAAMTYLAPGYRLHFDSLPTMDGAAAGQWFGQFFQAFPGIQHRVIDQIGEGDLVVSRLEISGQHTGDFQGLPPSGRRISIGAINIHRVEDGKIVEHWVSSDSLGMLQQLGVVPTPEQTPA